MLAIISFIIIIGILVLVHEFGHFITARLSGMRADIFSIGMGKRVLGYNKITGFTFGSVKLASDEDKTKDPDAIELNGHTDYRISLLPIGGYVKIVGMVDESMDTEFAGQEPKPWEFRSKTAFAKAVVISAGVIMNFILAVFLYGLLSFSYGKTELKTTEIAYVSDKSMAQDMGLQTGDKILSVNGTSVSNWTDLLQRMTLGDFGSDKALELERNGQKMSITADGVKILKNLEAQKPLGISPAGIKIFFTSVISLDPAHKAGMKVGDTILTINNEVIASREQLISTLQANKKTPCEVSWKSGNEIVTKTITPTKNGTLGIGLQDAITGETYHKDYSFVESASIGFSTTIDNIDMFFKMVSHLVSGNLKFNQSVAGPVTIAKQAGIAMEMGIQYFLKLMAMLSITLAIINILPFPALDGGHLVFIIIEAIARREVPIKIKMYIQQAGIIVLLGFMAYVIILDIFFK